jgi:hypothetical protein
MLHLLLLIANQAVLAMPGLLALWLHPGMCPQVLLECKQTSLTTYFLQYMFLRLCCLNLQYLVLKPLLLQLMVVAAIAVLL